MTAEPKKPSSKTVGSDSTEPQKDKRAEYLTARQLSEVLQVSEATIHRLRRTGRIPAVLLTDRLIRFNLRDVQRALKPHSAPQPEEPEHDDEPSPQLSFDDLLAESSE